MDKIVNNIWKFQKIICKQLYKASNEISWWSERKDWKIIIIWRTKYAKVCGESSPGEIINVLNEKLNDRAIKIFIRERVQFRAIPMLSSLLRNFRSRAKSIHI